MSTSSSRYPAIEATVKLVIKTLSGRDLSEADSQATFFDLGFDSLLLTQVSQSLRQKFNIKISFRQLMETLVTIEAVSQYLDNQVPAEKSFEPIPATTSSPVMRSHSASNESSVNQQTSFNRRDLIDRVMKRQIELMNQQLDLLRTSEPVTELNGLGSISNGPLILDSTDKRHTKQITPASESVVRFGPFKPVDRSREGGLTERQQQHLTELTDAYVKRTARSKAYTQRHRPHFADPRSVAGFRQNWKEMVYPVVVKRSSGSRFWDLDNNEYIDLTMGFGTNLFGHSPDFLTRAISNQLKNGVEVGPQSPLAGKVAALMCELTGMERSAFCSTGSEAVLAAVRLARTVTGRTRIATMNGYHGINDEVLVRSTVVNGERRPAPIAPGIPQHIVDQVLVLDYGTPESLELLRAHAHELAAVLVEPVQSRRPELQPLEFLKEVRKITAESETVLIFDELITGFRAHPGGTQKLFGIEADLATYGKIIGGGMPIGALCGKAKYMDALDGGHWQYGDDSSPEVGMTFFAGTYVRHPLAVRAALSVLTKLKREGAFLQEALSERMSRLGNDLNAYFLSEQIPMKATWFRSMMYFVFQQEFKYSNLLFFHLRLKGLHIWEGRPVFLSTAHTEEEIDFVLRVFKESLEELRRGGFLPEAIVPELVINPVSPKKQVLEGTVNRRREMEFSLYFFGNYDAAYREDKYALLKDAAKFADERGFTAVWLPERHFHAVGGFSPNASLLACALASLTSRLQLRGGSVVLPLHHPVRVAEEWAVADNLSHGRTAISIATGWHPNDFVFAPEAFEDRRKISLQNLEVIQKLWRGETVDLPTPGGESLPVKLHPLPKQKELPVWLTCIHKDSYAEAGRRGLNVLGYLMNQTVDELAEKILAYREGRSEAGFDPDGGHVTTLLFTYLDETVEKARETARGPLCSYLRSYLDNSQRKIERQIGEVEVEEEDLKYLTDRSCEDYFNGKSLVGTAESCAVVVERLRGIGVDEIGCFVDFGVEDGQVLRSLERVTELMEVDRVLPLTPAEQGLWMLGAMNREAALAYREAVTLKLTGELDRRSLERALQKVVERHGGLRTTIDAEGGTQTIRVRAGFELEEMDGVFGLKRLKKESDLDVYGFLGMEGPFFQAVLVKEAAERYLLVLFFHHVVGNGPSYWVILEELAALYAAYTRGETPHLPEVFPFAEFVERRRLYEESPEAKEAEAFWVKQMEGGVPGLDLPYDHPLPPELTYRGDRQEIVLEPELTEALKRVGAAQRCSLFMVLLSAYGVLLHRLSGQDDLVMGVPFDSPIRLENPGRNLYANTTNMLPLRSVLAEGSTFLEYLAEVKSRVLAASEHQDYFFGNLVGKLKLPRNPARSPFFNVVFNLEVGDFHRSLPGLEMALETKDVPYRSPRGSAMFDLYLNAAERKGGEILVQCDYNVALLEAETLGRWLAFYKTLLRSIAGEPEQVVAELPLVEAELREGKAG